MKCTIILTMRDYPLFGVICLAAILLGGCGATDGVDPTAAIGEADTSISLTATISVPGSSTNLAASLSKGAPGIGKATVTDNPASSGMMNCSAYTLRGAKIGEATNDADGSLTLAASLRSLCGSEFGCPNGSTFTRDIVLRCNNTDNSQEIRKSAQLTITKGSTVTLDLGTADSITTIAATAVDDNCNVDVTTGAACAATVDLDMPTVVSSTDTLYRDLTGTNGASDDLLLQLDAVRAMQAAKIKPIDYEFSNYSDLIRNMRGGQGLTGSALGDVSTLIAAVRGTTAAEVQEQLTTAASVTTKIQLVTRTLARQVAGSSSSQFDIKNKLDDPEYMKALWGPIVADDDPTSIAQFGDTKRLELLTGTVNQVSSASDYARFYDINGRSAIQSYYASIDTSAISTIKLNDLKGPLAMIKDLDMTKTSTQLRNVTVGLSKQIYEIGGGDWETAKLVADDGSIDTIKLQTLRAYFEDDNFNPDNATSDYFKTIQNIVLDKTSDIDEIAMTACLSREDLTSRQDCLSQFGFSGFGSGPPSFDNSKLSQLEQYKTEQGGTFNTFDPELFLKFQQQDTANSGNSDHDLTSSCSAGDSTACASLFDGRLNNSTCVYETSDHFGGDIQAGDTFTYSTLVTFMGGNLATTCAQAAITAGEESTHCVSATTLTDSGCSGDSNDNNNNDNNNGPTLPSITWASASPPGYAFSVYTDLNQQPPKLPTLTVTADDCNTNFLRLEVDIGSKSVNNSTHTVIFRDNNNGNGTVSSNDVSATFQTSNNKNYVYLTGAQLIANYNALNLASGADSYMQYCINDGTQSCNDNSNDYNLKLSFSSASLCTQ